MSSRIGMAKSELVAHTLEREIREGRFGHGDQLDSEGGLMRRFSVSRNTVRRGLEMLARQGLITTRTGIGSFVTYDGATIDSTLGWTVALSHGAGPVSTLTLSLRRGGSVKADRHLGGTGDYLCIDRLRYCETAGWGISLERSRLPWRDAFKGVLHHGLIDGSLNRTFDELGLASVGGQEVAGVGPGPSPGEGGGMGRQAGNPVRPVGSGTRRAGGVTPRTGQSTRQPGRAGAGMGSCCGDTV